MLTPSYFYTALELTNRPSLRARSFAVSIASSLDICQITHLWLNETLNVENFCKMMRYSVCF